MKLLLVVGLLLSAYPTWASAHGGGCRKADLPACCHRDNRTGTEHCH